MARDILTDLLFPDRYNDSRETSNWWVDLNDYFQSVFLDLVGAQFIIKKYCQSCKETRSRQKHSPAYPMITYYKNSVNPNDLFGQFEDDLRFHSSTQDAVDHCIVGSKLCKGPSINLSKRLTGCKGNLLVFAFSNQKDTKLEEIPSIAIFDDKRFILRACIGRNRANFVSYIKKEDYWLYYDGMETPLVERFAKTSHVLDSKVNRYPICSIMYEYDETDNNSPTSSQSPIPSLSSYKSLPVDSDEYDYKFETRLDDTDSISTTTVRKEPFLKTFSSSWKKKKNQLKSEREKNSR